MELQELRSRLSQLQPAHPEVASYAEPLLAAFEAALQDPEGPCFQQALQQLHEAIRPLLCAGTTPPAALLTPALLHRLSLPALRLRGPARHLSRPIHHNIGTAVSLTPDGMDSSEAAQMACGAGLWLLSGLDVAAVSEADAFKVARAAERFMSETPFIHPLHNLAAGDVLLRVALLPGKAEKILVELATTTHALTELNHAAARPEPLATGYQDDAKDMVVFRRFQAVAARITGLMLAVLGSSNKGKRWLAHPGRAPALREMVSGSSLSQFWTNVVEVALDENGDFASSDKLNALFAILDYCETMPEANTALVRAGGARLLGRLSGLGSAACNLEARLRACLEKGGASCPPAAQPSTAAASAPGTSGSRSSRLPSAGESMAPGHEAPAAGPASPDVRSQPPQRRQAKPVKQCAVCSASGAEVQLRRCSGCRAIRYCGPACQAADWPRHRGECVRL